MAAKTYREYLAPVYELIDENYTDGREIRQKDLRIIACFTAAVIFNAQETETDSSESKIEGGEANG